MTTRLGPTFSPGLLRSLFPELSDLMPDASSSEQPARPLRFALTMLVVTFAVAGEALHLSAAEPAFPSPSSGSFYDAEADHSDDGDPSPTPGTLFRWSAAPDVTGGPDLSEPLITDRPDFTNSPFTVGKGVPQLESGYTFTYNEDAGETTRFHSIGEPFLRYGIFADFLELRLALSPVLQRTRGPGISQSTGGTEDLLIGAKFALTPQHGVLPATGLITEATVPTGSPAFTSDQFLPIITWTYSWDVTDSLGVTGNTIFSRNVETELPDIPSGSAPADFSPVRDAYTQWAQSVSVGYGYTDKLSGFYEWYGLFPHSAQSAQAQHYIDTGFTYLLTDDVQWDIRAGWGLTDASDDFFTGTGLSIRFQ